MKVVATMEYDAFDYATLAATNNLAFRTTDFSIENLKRVMAMMPKVRRVIVVYLTEDQDVLERLQVDHPIRINAPPGLVPDGLFGVPCHRYNTFPELMEALRRFVEIDETIEIFHLTRHECYRVDNRTVANWCLPWLPPRKKPVIETTPRDHARHRND